MERQFRSDDRDAQFAWQRAARELEIPPPAAYALYVRAVQRALDPRDAEALYLDWLRAAAARRVPHAAVPGRRTRVMADASANEASPAHEVAVPGKRTRVAAWDRDSEGRAAHLLRDAGGDAAPSPDDPAVATALRERGRGTPLPAPLRAEMEAHLGVSLAGVRLHDDAVAHAAAAAVRARAFTVGEDIYFAAGASAPGSHDGRHLLAHELAHVAQAIEGRVPDEGHRRVSQPSEPLELEARAIATRITAAPAPSGPWPGPRPGPRRDPLAMFAPPRTARGPGGPILRHGHDHDGGPTVATPSPQTPASPPAGQPPGQTPPVQAVDVLEASEPFRAFGPPASAQVVMRRAWLVAQGVAATEQNITVQAHPGPVRAVMRDLRDRVFPWATADRLEEVSATAQIGLPAPLGQLPEQFARPVERSILGAFGLPTGARIVTYRRTTGLEIWFDADYLRSLHPRTVGGRSVIRDPALMERYATALETEVGAAMRPDWRRALLGSPFTCAVQLDRIDHVYFHRIDEQALIAAFGDEAIRAYRGRTEAAGDGQAVVASPAGNVTLPPGLSADDRRRVERLLPQIYGDHGAATPTRLTDADVQALRQLDADPDRAEILALMRTARHGGAQDPEPSLADRIDTVRQQVAIHRSAAQPPLSGEARHPLVPRPVHGHIRNRSGELVPGMEGQFDFVEDDVVDRFSVPRVIIHWAAVQTHDVQVASDGRTVHQVALASPVRIATEVTHYISVDPQGALNDRIFNFRFRQPGVYQIEAVVDHSFYFPAHFTLAGGVEVLPEAARHREQQDRAFAGLTRGPTTTERHHFAVWGHGDGERTRGRLAPGALERPAGETNTQSMDDEIRQLEALQHQYEHSDEADARAIVEYVQTRLSHLRDARRALGASLADRASQVVRTWGAYTSRTAGVTSGDLRIVTWLRGQGDGQLEGHLLDHTQLHEAQNYQFSETGGEREAILEALFVALTRSYPEGTLTLRFELPGSPGQFVQYTRVTDTIRRDVTGIVFSQPVAIAVNLTALVVGIFNPLAGILISVAYNGAQTADDLQHQAAQGTLTWQHTATSLGLLAIDLLPAAGLSSRFLQLGRTAYYLLEATQLAGSALLVAPQAAERIALLREGRIRELARLEDTIRTRRANNPSDAGLRDLDAQAHALRAEIESQGRQVIAEMVAQQLIVVVTGAVVQGMMRRQISERVRGSAVHDIAAITSGEQLHVPVGSSMARADGEAALAALARGDRGALASAGLGRLPEAFDPRSVRWGLAELPDGDVILLRGGPDGVDWSQLPAGVRRLSETDGGTVRAVSSPEASGAGDGSGGHDGSGGGHDGSGGPRRVYVAADPVQLATYRTEYPDVAQHPDGTRVYRYADTTAIPDNGVSYWQTDAPHIDYTSPVVIETTMGELRRSGEVRVDGLAPRADVGESLVVLHNPGTTTMPGTTRRVLGRAGAQGTGAPVLEGEVPSGLWRDWDGNIHDGPDLFRPAPGRGGGGHGSGTAGDP